MEISDPNIYYLPNNKAFEVIVNNQGLTLVNMELLIVSSVIDGTIVFTRQSRPGVAFEIPITLPTVVKWTTADVVTVDVQDTNSYSYYLKVRYITFNTTAEYKTYLNDYDISIQLGQAGSVAGTYLKSPLDSQGRLETNPNTEPGELDFVFTTSATAGDITQISTDATARSEVTILAPSTNTANVLVGGSTPTFPLIPGSSVSLRNVSLSQIYASSTAASQTLYIITGGT